MFGDSVECSCTTMCAVSFVQHPYVHCNKTWILCSKKREVSKEVWVRAKFVRVSTYHVWCTPKIIHRTTLELVRPAPEWSQVKGAACTRTYIIMGTALCGSLCCTCAVGVSACFLGLVREDATSLSHLIQSRPLRCSDLLPTGLERNKQRTS